MPMPAVLETLRRRTGGRAIEFAFEAVSRLASIHPRARSERGAIDHITDISYGPDPIHKLDVWRPLDRGNGPLPVILYIHGGGFRILSKETHWIMALALARRGFIVFNIDYRLAPEHPFPAALEDASRAWGWVCEHAERFGGDPNRISLGGESAGANLSAALTIAACWEREEPYAREVFMRGIVPRSVLAACGILQVTDVQRFWRERDGLPSFVRDRFEEVTHGYLGAREIAHAPGKHDLADPLVFLERAEPPARALPPFISPVGTRDALIHDALRLAPAIERLGGSCSVPIYEGEVHAFHAFVWRENARQCWRDIYAFLDEHA